MGGFPWQYHLWLGIVILYCIYYFHIFSQFSFLLQKIVYYDWLPVFLNMDETEYAYDGKMVCSVVCPCQVVAPGTQVFFLAGLINAVYTKQKWYSNDHMMKTL